MELKLQKSVLSSAQKKGIITNGPNLELALIEVLWILMKRRTNRAKL